MHPIDPSIHSGIGGTMYLLLIVLVPVLLLVNTRLAMAGLIVVIVVAYIQRTRSVGRKVRNRALDSSPYKAAYED
jgi:hypothetical protein